MEDIRKSIQEVFHLGETVIISNKVFRVENVMLIGLKNKSFSCVRVKHDSEHQTLFIDPEKQTVNRLSSEQISLYRYCNLIIQKRLQSNKDTNLLMYNAKNIAEKNTDLVSNAFNGKDLLDLSAKFSIENVDITFSWYGLFGGNSGDSLVVAISSSVMVEYVSKFALYNDVFFAISMKEAMLDFHGTIVRIENIGNEFLLYIHPYPLEVMQSTLNSGALFCNITNPFAIMDFLVNHIDSDVQGVVYPQSDFKPVHDYIVAGVIKNINFSFDECVLGNVRIGNSIEISSHFKDKLSVFDSKKYTIIWVNVKEDSPYNAFLSGKKLLQAASELIVFMLKNDMYTDWYGTGDFANHFSWDVQNHYPRVELDRLFYIENCIQGDSITLTDENLRSPQEITIPDEAEYLFDEDWIDTFFKEIEEKNAKVLRLQYALKWVIQAWHADDAYDRLIYCSMALEFIVNGEKGLNIFDEYAKKAGRNQFTKTERKALIENITTNTCIESIDGLLPEVCSDLNLSIKKMIASKLSEVSFVSKLDTLISRLNIPLSQHEKDLLIQARKKRNELIHGFSMSSMSTLEIRKLCGITSRILMYKLQNEFRKE